MESAPHSLPLDELLRSALESAELPYGSLTTIQMQNLLESLPRLTEAQVKEAGHDSTCPICFTPLLALLSEEELALAMHSPAHATEELGVTRLSVEGQCGHIFCRRDIVRWIKEGRNSCPMCRHPLLAPERATPANASTASEAQNTMAQRLLRYLTNEMSPFGIDISPPASDTERLDENRSNYSGMYS